MRALDRKRQNVHPTMRPRTPRWNYPPAYRPCWFVLRIRSADRGSLLELGLIPAARGPGKCQGGSFQKQKRSERAIRYLSDLPPFLAISGRTLELTHRLQTESRGPPPESIRPHSYPALLTGPSSTATHVPRRALRKHVDCGVNISATSPDRGLLASKKSNSDGPFSIEGPTDQRLGAAFLGS